MMTNEEIIAEATATIESRTGYHLRADLLEAAVAEGLVDGDRIDLGVSGGLHLVATIAGDEVTMAHGDAATTLPLASLSAVQRERMLVAKAVQRGARP